MSSKTIKAGNALSAQRIQYRVGHGGFHASIVKDSNSKQHLVYVYDVGACPDVSLLEEAIERFVARLVDLKIKQVQYVILSHIDDDHVNRLEYLLGELKGASISIGTLTLPWLRNTSRLLTLSRAPRRGTSSTVYQLLQSDALIATYAVRLGFENVLFIESDSGDFEADGEDDTDPPIATSRFQASNVTYIASGTPLPVPQGMPWTLLITHLKPPEKTLRAFDKRVLKLTGLNPADQADHDALITKHKPEIRVAMRFAAQKTKLNVRTSTVSNWSSQSLYSASHGPLVRHSVPQAPSDFEMSCVHGWLHTGDLPLDVPEVWDAFERAWDLHLPDVEVCVALAPHHGSIHGHNADLYDRFKPSAVLFPLGLWRGSRRGKPMFAKRIKPKTAMKAVRAFPGIKIRMLNNRI